MIDLTPLDVRKKRGDFRKVLRGYDVDEVDGFIQMVAERLEELVKENLTLRERVDRLHEQVSQQENREEAVREALVTAQELRRDMRLQARREAELLRREAEGEIEKMLGEAQRRLVERREALEEVERMRLRFLKSFRALLEREMDAVEVEEGRKPLEDAPLEIDFTVKELEARAELPDGEPGPDRPEDAFGSGPSSRAGGEGSGDSEAVPSDGAAGARGSASTKDESDSTADGGGTSPARSAAASAVDSEPAGTEPEGEGGVGDASDREEDESLWLSSILQDDEEKEGRTDDGR